MANSIEKMSRWDHLLKAIGLGSLTRQEQVRSFTKAVTTTAIGISPRWYETVFSNGINAYQNSAIVYSIVNRITKMAAIPQFKVYRVKDKKKHLQYKAWTGENATYESIQRALQIKELVYEEDDSHPMNVLIEKPNPWQKRDEFTVNSVGFKLLKGNRFWHVPLLGMGADGALPSQVYNLAPDFMEVISDGTIYGVQEYRFIMGGERQTIPKEEIIHSKYFNPNVQSDGSHLIGQSPISAGRRNLTRIDSAISRSVAMLQNAGAAGLLYERDAAADERSEEQMAELRDKINSRINGSDNSGAVTYMAGDMGYINFGIPSSDMELLATEKYSTQNLCNIFSFPPGAFDPDKATYANSKEFNKQIITGAVIPEESALRDDWNEVAKRYKRDVIYVDYDLSVFPELQEDQDVMAARLEKMPYYTYNEKRIMTGGDEVKDPLMDKIYVPSSLVPLDQLGEANLLEGLDDDEAG